MRLKVRGLSKCGLAVQRRLIANRKRSFTCRPRRALARRDLRIRQGPVSDLVLLAERKLFVQEKVPSDLRLRKLYELVLQCVREVDTTNPLSRGSARNAIPTSPKSRRLSELVHPQPESRPGIRIRSDYPSGREEMPLASAKHWALGSEIPHSPMGTSSKNRLRVILRSRLH
jgi:hypothetical protein